MKILVIDGDPRTSDMLAVGFREHHQELTLIQTVDGESGLRAFHQHGPDVVLVETSTVGGSGLEVLQEIRRASDVPVIVLSTRSDEAAQVRALELGADDYVVNPPGFMVLVARVGALLRRAEMSALPRTSPDFLCGELRISFRSRKVTLRGKPVRLTPVEYGLLYHLVRHTGRTVSYGALLSRLPADGQAISQEHLGVFIRRLRAKIEIPGGPRLIKTERGRGYRFIGVERPGGGR